MRISRVLHVIAATVLAATYAHAQSGPDQAGQVPAFRSDAELSPLLRDLSKRSEKPYGAQYHTARPEAEKCKQEEVSLRSRNRTGGGSDTAVISGRIASSSGLPLAGAVVLLSDTEAGNISALDGTYRLDIPVANLPNSDKLTLEARIIGYRSKSLQLSVSQGDSVVVDFVLCPATLKL